MSDESHPAGPSRRRIPTPLTLGSNPRQEPERSNSLGRVLQSTWTDKASPLYDCFDAVFRDEQAGVGPWLAHQKQQNQNNGFLKAAERRFDATLAVLRAAHIAYDPREPGAPLPVNGVSRSRARDAQYAWQELCRLRDEAARFEHILVGAADSKQREARAKLELVRRAHVLHVRFMADVIRKALRWRVLGRTVMFGVRWVNRVLRAGRRRRSAAAGGLEQDGGH